MVEDDCELQEYTGQRLVSAVEIDAWSSKLTVYLEDATIYVGDVTGLPWRPRLSARMFYNSLSCGAVISSIKRVRPNVFELNGVAYDFSGGIQIQIVLR